MADDQKFVALRARTPAPSSARATGRTYARLPDDLMAEQVDRLAVFSAVIAGLWGLGLVLDVTLTPIVWGGAISIRAVSLEISGIVLAGLMFWYVRYVPDSPQRKTDVSLVYLILNGLGVAILTTWVVPPTNDKVIQLSWTTVGILVYSMISPASTRKMLVACLVTASMDPLALTVAYLLGHPITSVPHGIILAVPNYACALIAVVPSRVLHRLGRRLREAQDLGSYELVELLGNGGMGEVWRARHRLLARAAAVKLVRPEMLGARDDAGAHVLQRRFEREARATAALNSPHTINVFDFGMTDEGTFYYVMELLAGRDVESLVREFGPVSADRAIFLLRQVCHSLAEAHARGLVHRDIKPANIYVCRMGLEYDFIKVLDFGLVKVRSESAETQTMLTVEHSPTGTPAYMAPEVILGEGTVDRRADVYAVGCVAYYLLTGQLVFEADTTMKMLLQHVNATPLPPSQRTELRIPRELDDLVLACLQKDPSKRPQDAEELFSMACRCQSCGSWDQNAAKAWWQIHLPDLTGPLTLSEPESEPAPPAVSAT